MIPILVALAGGASWLTLDDEGAGRGQLVYLDMLQIMRTSVVSEVFVASSSFCFDTSQLVKVQD